jgi:hypothetical protein
VIRQTLDLTRTEVALVLGFGRAAIAKIKNSDLAARCRQEARNTGTAIGSPAA